MSQAAQLPIVIAAVIAFCAGINGPDVKSARAKRALARFDAVLTKAKSAYKRAVEPAKKQALEQLNLAIKEAHQNNDPEDAEQIKEAKDNIVDIAPNAPMSAVELQRTLIGTTWTWADGYRLQFTAQGYRLSYWRAHEIGTFKAVSGNTAICTPPKGRGTGNGHWEFIVNQGFTHFLLITDKLDARTGQLVKE